MAFNRIKLQPDEEIKSELIRLYLEDSHPSIFTQLQKEVGQVTNHIVRSRRDVKNACVAYAIRNKLVDSPPIFPIKPLLPSPLSDEDRLIISQAWKDYYKSEAEVKIKYAKWLKTVFTAVKAIPECAWRADSYQLLQRLYGKIGSAHLFRDTVSRVRDTKRAKAKSDFSKIPLFWGNSPLVETGSFYGDRRGKPFYNALVKVPGVGPIKGRLRRPLPGRPVQGVTLTRKADGWYAAVKCVVKKRLLPEASLPAIGVDVGQTDLVALSDGYIERNIRDADFVAIKAAIQESGDRSTDPDFQKVCRGKVARMDQNHKRRIVHWINSDLLPKLEKHSHVFVEKLAKNFKSDKGPLSCMHMILNAVKQRLGNLDPKGKLGPNTRVFEVNPAYTSQTCSYCKTVSETARKSKIYTCQNTDCNVVLDADVNAARNILDSGLQMLGLVA